MSILTLNAEKAIPTSVVIIRIVYYKKILVL